MKIQPPLGKGAFAKRRTKMKKLKTLGIITIVFLLLIITAFAVVAALGFFQNETGGETVIEPEKPLEQQKSWIVPEGGKTAVLKTEAGEIKILLSDSAAAEKFIEFVNSGAVSGIGFETLAENMFIQTGIFGENFAAEKTDFACVNGAVGFVLDGENAAPSFFIITNTEITGFSKSYMTEKSFDEEKAAYYLEKGGVPEYEGKVIIFGKVVSGTETIAKIASGENSGYTGGYSAAEPIKITSAEIE